MCSMQTGSFVCEYKFASNNLVQHKILQQINSQVFNYIIDLVYLNMGYSDRINLASTTIKYLMIVR